MSFENTNVTAVVVTYNRLEYLKEIIDALRDQTHKIEKIIVVDNASADGTLEWLDEQKDIILIRQENVGSSGGQYTGIKSAFEIGSEWIWTMDDDVVPAVDCLENLLENPPESHLKQVQGRLFEKGRNLINTHINNEVVNQVIGMDIIRVPLRYQPNGKPFYNDVVRYNLRNPFRKFWQEIISENHLTGKFIPVEGITFEGPLFHRSVVERIGLPEKNFFIFGDDTEYFLRVRKFNIKIELCMDARLNRKLEVLPLKKIHPSRKFYFVRNLIAINVKHGSNSVRLIRPFVILFLWIFRARSLSDLKYIIKGFIKGYFYKSDN